MNGLASIGADLLRLTVTDPRAAARRVIGIGAGLGTDVLWLALVLLTALSTLLSHLVLVTVPVPDGAEAAGMFGIGPIAMAGLQLALMAGFVLAVAAIGRRAGGNGDLTGALSIILWLEVLALGLQAAQVVLLAFGPGLADMIGLAGVILFWTLLSFFVAELHGFRSVGRVFLGIALTVLIAAFAISLLLLLMGVQIGL